MSKTSDGSWIAAAARAYSRRFAALVTGFARKYRDDFFLRTEVNIIALQVAYAVLILLFCVGALIILYNDIVTGIVTGIATALTSTTTPLSTASLSLGLEAARTREILGVTFFVVLGAFIFGYLAARFALAPARNALAAQKQFIGNIAHELRTPLAIIKANTEIRLFDPNVPENARELHESNLEELDRISDIINNLLSLNALVRPERIPFRNVDVAQIAERSIEKLSPAVKKKPVELTLDVRTARNAWGNPSAIEQIVTNLVRNATQHTAQGAIVVGINDGRNESVELTVRDTGAGIRREDLLRVFEPFYRGDKARTRAGGGSGLGLAIVNELVRLHQGQIGIQSTLGKGTVVTVMLPGGHGTEFPARTASLFTASTKRFPAA